MSAKRPRPTPAMKRRQRIILLGFLIFCSLIAAGVGFVPNKDLADYKRLVDGSGAKVAATSTGGVTSTFSGRRGSGRTKYCTSWRYEIDGNERFFTDRHDCYAERQDAPNGSSAELIYDPQDRATMFVSGQKTLKTLEGTGTTTRLIGIGGGIAAVVGIVGLYFVIRRKPADTV